MKIQIKILKLRIPIKNKALKTKKQRTLAWDEKQPVKMMGAFYTILPFFRQGFLPFHQTKKQKAYAP
jgi:hypothetical protein